MVRLNSSLLVGLMLFAVAAEAQAGPREGNWRLELSGLHIFQSTSGRYDGDLYFTGMVEYEVPVGSRGKLGLRLLPLFVKPGMDAMYAGGAGVAGRIFQRKETCDGFFAEIGVSALYQSRELKDNSSRVNFLSEAGVGYKFPDSGVHVSLKIQHLSNASLGEDNAGINGVGLATGVSF